MVSDLMVVFDCLDGLQMRGSIRWQELHVLAESRKQKYGCYNINLLGSRLASFLPKWGKQRAQVGQARYPTWASTLLHLGMVAARMLPICPRYGKLRLGLSRILLVHLFETNQDYLSLPFGGG